jgi:endonuclease/exonuclease/phosphatase family metal-dependent hydrolase
MPPKINREDEIDKRAEEMFNSHPDLQGSEIATGKANADNQALNDIAKNYDQSADPSQENANIARAREQSGEWKTSLGSASSSGQNQSGIAGRIMGFVKSKKGATTGIIGGTGIAGIILSSLFGPFTLLHNLQANALETNDSRSSTLERRLVKILEKKFGTDRGGACDLKKYPCKKNKMPNKMLRELSRQGIKPLDADGRPMSTSKKTGYTADKPTSWEIPDGSGGTKVISANQFVDEYKKNAFMRGTFKKAFNMRYRGWTGKFISKVFYGKYGVKNDGGVASEDDTDKEKVRSDLEARIGPDDASGKNSEAMFKETVEKKIGKASARAARTSDPILMAASAGCMVVKGPKIYAGLVRGLQMAKIILLVSDLILSPAGKTKAGETSPKAVEAIGSTLTETDTNRKSALDSAILLSAIGVNKSRVTPSEKFVPGLSTYNSPAVKASVKGSAFTADGCNLVNSPQAAVASASITAASAATGPGAAIYAAIKATIKVAAVFGAVELASDVIAAVAGKMASKLCSWFCDDAIAGFTDAIKDAKGLELGDALGTGLFAFFSQGGSAGGLAVLSHAQLADSRQTLTEVASDHREEDMATLSPFDTSSKYTFMGSMAYSLSSSNLSSNSPIGTMGGILRSPLQLLSPSVSAAETSHDYKDMFDLSNAALTPAGTPYTGIPSKFLGMDTDEVYDLATEGDCSEDKDECKHIDMETGEVNYDEQDSELGDVLSTCQAPDLDELDGCVIQSASGEAHNDNFGCEENDEECISDAYSSQPASQSENKSASHFLYTIDNQVENILNGEDEEEPAIETSIDGAGGSFRVATFNILHDGSEPHERIWKDRLPRSIDAITSNHIDIAGLQEVRQVQLAEFKKNNANGDYPIKFDYFPKTTKNPGYSPNLTIWDSDKFDFIAGETHRIKYFGNETPDHMVLVKLRYKETGQVIYFGNTHDPRLKPPVIRQDRRDNAQVYKDLFQDAAEDGIPMFLTGDFNSNSDGYCILSGPGSGIINAYDAAHRPVIQGKCPSKSKVKIDHIYLTNSDAISASGIQRVYKEYNYNGSRAGGNNGSDHDMVYADIAIEGEDGESGSSQSAEFGTVGFPLKGNKSVVKNPDIFRNNTTTLSDHPYTAYDIFANTGTEVTAFASGKVSYVSTDSCGGKFLKIWNERAQLGITYMHLSDHIPMGKTVNVGDHVGTVGSAGAGCGTPHLHIDASIGKIRKACDRSSCTIQSEFRSIGKDLYNTYQRLPG